VVDQLFARVSSGGTAAWYYTDRLGSVRQMVDGSGVAQNTITYDGWGNVVSESNGSFGDRWKWTGRELDSETGLQYNRWRYYVNTVGRWTNQDPIRFHGGDVNLYRYAGNSSILVLDPLGLDWSWEGAAQGAWNGAIAGGVLGGVAGEPFGPGGILVGGSIGVSTGAAYGALMGGLFGPLPGNKKPGPGVFVGVGIGFDFFSTILPVHVGGSFDIYVSVSFSHGVVIGVGPTGGVQLGEGIGVSVSPQITLGITPTVADLDGASLGGEITTPGGGGSIFETGPGGRTKGVIIQGPGLGAAIGGYAGQSNSKIWTFPPID
jgi:RHS repeat-associated protein